MREFLAGGPSWGYHFVLSHPCHDTFFKDRVHVVQIYIYPNLGERAIMRLNDMTSVYTVISKNGVWYKNMQYV